MCVGLITETAAAATAVAAATATAAAATAATIVPNHHHHHHHIHHAQVEMHPTEKAQRPLLEYLEKGGVLTHEHKLQQ